MFANLLLAAAFQVGPFYEQRPEADYCALRPLWSQEGEKTDVLWPIFAERANWWRFCFFTHWQHSGKTGYQFEVMPLWFNGRTDEGETYAGLFPIWGHHPHVLFMHDFDFCLWPVWTSYRMPRPSKDGWLQSRAVLFPLVSWRDDGAWGLWPIYGVNYQRESDHRYALWPIVTWASYRADRDTAGAGSSWMVWPICASVTRERESQTSFIPPFFSTTHLADGGWRVRCPYPIVEIERTAARHRESVFPLYERVSTKAYSDRSRQGDVYRFGWRLVEVYPEETRVFPFWTRSANRLRVWPFYERETTGAKIRHDVLSLFPITWVDSIDRNWAPFWTFYTRTDDPTGTDHSLLWGLIRWKCEK